MAENITIVTSNEKNSLTSDQRRADARKLFRIKPKAIMLWQELRSTADHDDIRALEPAGYTHLFGDLTNGMSIPPRFDIIETWWQRTKPETGLLPPKSAGVLSEYRGPELGEASRTMAWALLKDKESDLGRFWVCNTHMSSGVNWEATNPSEDNKFLRAWWELHWALMKKEVDWLRLAQASDPNDRHYKTIFYGMDSNRQPDFPTFTAGEILGTPSTKIDRLAVIARNVNASKASYNNVIKAIDSTTDPITGVTTETEVERYSDHDAYWVDWAVSNA